jgi:ribosome-associated protein
MEAWDREDALESPASPRRITWSIGTTTVGLASAGLEVGGSDGDDRLSSAVAALVDLLDPVANTEGGTLSLATLAPPTLRTIPPALERACMAAQVALDHKGKDVLVLDMRGITPLYDFFIIASGNSRRQIHTMAEEVDRRLADAGDKRLSIAGYEASKWVVQDYGDVIVHLFDPATREYYGLEDLWADAPRIDWQRE